MMFNGHIAKIGAIRVCHELGAPLSKTMQDELKSFCKKAQARYGRLQFKLVVAETEEACTEELRKQLVDNIIGAGLERFLDCLEFRASIAPVENGLAVEIYWRNGTQYHRADTPIVAQ